LNFFGEHNETYQTGREIGSGGEGRVLEVNDHALLVAKIYTTLPDSEKTDKLRTMLAMRNDSIEAYTAWPQDLLHGQDQRVTGFTMKKLSGYVPLHMVFSPMDRKKRFPDKGYNFLVHVARNLAGAFMKLHGAGLVVGDVNEGNILINGSGIVCFIDCDSFQIRKTDGNGYFYCDVGIPRYTPPELLKEQSFEGIARSTNTDNFSLAILIFQLLFLGRHPFAGKNTTQKDIDEETAIKTHEFAYSLKKKRKKLLPPNDSMQLEDLPDPVVALFHQAFEDKTRPTAAQWLAALEQLLADMATCSLTKLHTYPSTMAACPWCRFRKERGILFFLDDSYLHATNLLSDIDAFVNGFKTEHLEIERLQQPFLFRDLTVAAPEAYFRQRAKMIQAGVVFSVVAGLVLAFFQPLFLLLCFFGPYAVYHYSPWRRELEAEIARRKKEHATLERLLREKIAEHDHPGDLLHYERGLEQLERGVATYRQLPEITEHKRQEMEEAVYNEQLSYYLACFKLEHHEIPAIGDVRKKSLIQHGILSAAEVGMLAHTKVPGIGPRNYQVLLSWQRQVASNFLYIPDDAKMQEGMATVARETAALRARLEATIRKEFQAVNYLKDHIMNRNAVLMRQASEIAMREQRARMELEQYQHLTKPPFYELIRRFNKGKIR